MDFKFNIDNLIRKATEKWKNHIDGLTIRLPFITVSIKPNDIEKTVAREILIKLPDKRVLSSKDCCDKCIDKSLASLQEVRKILVDSQVKLSNFHNGGLYLLVELMAEGLRQFITFEEKLKTKSTVYLNVNTLDAASNRPNNIRQEYFNALEKLRFHIHSCLNQVSIIAEMETPKLDSYLKSDDEWLLSLYNLPNNLVSW